MKKLMSVLAMVLAAAFAAGCGHETAGNIIVVIPPPVSSTRPANDAAFSEIRVLLQVENSSLVAEVDATSMGGKVEKGDYDWLEKRLALFAEDENVRCKVPVIIEAYPDVAYSWVIRTLNACRKAKLEVVNFAALKGSEPAGKTGPEPPRPAPAQDHPPEPPSPPDDPSGRLVISVDQHNRIWVFGRQKTLAEVARILQMEKRARGAGVKRTDLAVLISAYKDAKWGTVQAIVEAANRVGLRKLSFTVAPRSNPAPKAIEPEKQ